MFHDRQAQSSAADGFGVAFVYAIEAFEDSAAVFSRDSDAVVFDADLYAFSKILQMDAYRTVISVILDSVITQIIDHFFQYRTNCTEDQFLAVNKEMYVLLCCDFFQVSADILCYGICIYFSHSYGFSPRQAVRS